MPAIPIQNARSAARFRDRQPVKIPPRRATNPARLLIAGEPGLDKFEILEDQVGLGVLVGEDGVGIQQLICFDHIYLDVGFLICFNQFVRLVEAWVLEVVLSDFQVGDAEQNNLHS